MEVDGATVDIYGKYTRARERREKRVAVSSSKKMKSTRFVEAHGGGGIGGVAARAEGDSNGDARAGVRSLR